MSAFFSVTVVERGMYLKMSHFCF